jgi:hypothetical protein
MTTEQMLCFQAAVLLINNHLEVNWCGTAATTTSPTGWGGEDKKSATTFFKPGKIQHLHIECGNESQMSLLSWRNRGCDMRQCSDKRFVVCPKLERTTFAKMTEMSNGHLGSPKTFQAEPTVKLWLSI